MPRTNLSLGNLYRAVSGSVRTGAVSLGGLAGASANSNASMISFATDAITVTPPTFTYIVESTSENAQFSFASTGSLFYNKVQQQFNNYTCSFNNSNFTTGSRTVATGPTIFPLNAAAIGSSTYSEASSTLTMKYEDGYNINATSYSVSVTKTLYAVDVYNTINEPDFCLLFGTKVTKENNTEINVEDLMVGDRIKAWVPDNLPDENLPIETDSLDWRFYSQDNIEGTDVIVTVSDIIFNFAAGYYEINDGIIKSTGTHPVYVWDAEIQKYKFKNVENILPGDLIVTFDETTGISEVEVYDIKKITEDVEIVTLNVEDFDVYLANKTISHNKGGGSASQPSIPASGLRMYLDPSKAKCFPANALPSTGTPTTDWLDVTGYNTGVRPAGVPNSAGYSGTSPAYNNGATRIDEYWSLTGSEYWFKDRNSNINGGITQFDSTAITFLAWVRLTANPGQTYGCLFSKSGADRDYNFYFYSSNASVWDGFHFSSARGTCSNTVQTFTAPALNAWHLVGFTISAAAGIAYYLNGSSVGTGTMTAFNATSSYDIKLGRDDNYAKCQLGPVLYYNKVLTSTEVQQVYNHFQPTYRP
jgi:hypothetical protein